MNIVWFVIGHSREYKRFEIKKLKLGPWGKKSPRKKAWSKINDKLQHGIT